MLTRIFQSSFCLIVVFTGLSLRLSATTPISFNAPKVFSAFSYDCCNSYRVIAGDFNGDGKQDVATIIDNSVAVLLGNGDGTFQPPLVTTPVTYAQWSAVAADFNGDGILDIALSVTTGAGNMTNAVQILLGNGDGTFQLLSQLAGTCSGSAIVVGDFNRDGKPDIAASCNLSGGAGLQILLGNGNGTFQAPITYASPDVVFSLAVADFNGDGFSDLAVQASTNLAILFGNGDGTFQPQVSLNQQANCYLNCIAAADFTGDGKMGLAVYSDNNVISILLGNGNGTFQPPVSYPVDGAVSYGYPSPLVIADLNHDGVPDIAAEGSGLSVLLGKGDGTFGPATFFALAGSSIAMADFNGDGNKDVASFDGLVVAVLLGGRHGGFQRPVKFQVGKNPASLVVADFNSDGKQDVAVANFGSDNVSVLLGAGSGLLEPALNYAVGGNPISLAVGDFNRDGKPDLAVANYGSSTVSVLLGTGNGSFQPAVGYTVAGADWVAIGDFNGDGKQDLAVAGGTANSVAILLGNGDGSFQAPVALPLPLSAGAVAVGDLNGDGKADLAVVLYNSEVVGSALGYAAVQLGNGDGSFQPPVLYQVGVLHPSAKVDIAIRDLNRDGILDLVVGMSGYGSSNAVAVLLGAGGGAFKAPLGYPVGAYSVAVGDFSGTGVLDLAVGSGNTVEILPGNGDGTFAQAGPQYEVPYGTHSMAVGDFNRDGKSDLVIANSSIATIALLTNTSP